MFSTFLFVFSLENTGKQWGSISMVLLGLWTKWHPQWSQTFYKRNLQGNRDPKWNPDCGWHERVWERVGKKNLCNFIFCV